MTGKQFRHLGVQFVRRSVQLLVIALVFGLVFVSLYAHYRAARALEDEQLLAGWKGKVFSVIDERVAEVEDPQEFLDGYKGTLWSMRLAGLDLTDPLAGAEVIAASKSIHVPLLLSILIPVILTLLLGRVFCSWICPAGLLFEISGKLRKVLRFAEIRPGEVKFSHRNKYVLLGVGLLVVGVVSTPIFALVYPPAVLSRLAHAWIFGTALSGMLLLIGVMVVFELFVSPRWWCRTMCPGGALYALLGWLRPLKVKLDQDLCTGCMKCIPVCEPGISPVRESEGLECDNCGVCIRHCPEGALSFGLSVPGRRGQQTQQADTTGNLDEVSSIDGGQAMSKNNAKRASVITTLVALALISIGPAAQAHHILGLPHYSYKDSYPQAPTLEYPATTGPYDVLLTSYPGKPVPAESANLAFYIKNRNTNTPYAQPIGVRVLQTFTFGRNREIVTPTEVAPFEVPHKLTVTFPEAGEYIVELTMDVEGVPEVIPFMMIAGEPTATTSILIVVGVGLALFLVAVRAVKIKRARRIALLSERQAAPVAG